MHLLTTETVILLKREQLKEKRVWKARMQNSSDSLDQLMLAFLA